MWTPALQGFDLGPEELVSRLIAATGVDPSRLWARARRARFHRRGVGDPWGPPRSCRAGPARELAEELRAGWLGAPVYADNEMRPWACLANWSGAVGAGSKDLAYIKVASGVGAGLVIDGKIIRGPGGTAAKSGILLLMNPVPSVAVAIGAAWRPSRRRAMRRRFCSPAMART